MVHRSWSRGEFDPLDLVEELLPGRDAVLGLVNLVLRERDKEILPVCGAPLPGLGKKERKQERKKERQKEGEKERKKDGEKEGRRKRQKEGRERERERGRTEGSKEGDMRVDSAASSDCAT